MGAHNSFGLLNGISNNSGNHTAANNGGKGEGLEAPIQLLYLLALLGFLAAGAYLVVRQVFVRRDLEEAAKVLGERIRSDSGNAEDFFELGIILLRKKLFTQATRNLEKAKKSWQGEEDELAKVHNALGYAYFNMDKSDLAVTEYKKAAKHTDFGLGAKRLACHSCLVHVVKCKTAQATLDAASEPSA
ncbi:hypothetical protein WJX84_001786 [Apatococcus fuscideae]|uniref:Uncharacterized protein n=1 Tax=Apatococcus fuscideae TaxID=2026836 RepID=A0AAW1SVN9_9CHLO